MSEKTKEIKLTGDNAELLYIINKTGMKLCVVPLEDGDLYPLECFQEWEELRTPGNDEC